MKKPIYHKEIPNLGKIGAIALPGTHLFDEHGNQAFLLDKEQR